jgi:hypothetical protein
VLLRRAYLGVANVFALLPMCTRDKDAEILALCHQLLACSGSSVRAGCGSPRVTGRCWRRFGKDKVLGGLTHEYYAAA